MTESSREEPFKIIENHFKTTPVPIFEANGSFENVELIDDMVLVFKGSFPTEYREYQGGERDEILFETVGSLDINFVHLYDFETEETIEISESEIKELIINLADYDC